jgi:RNA polymerase sigma factor (sigma-70 family)
MLNDQQLIKRCLKNEDGSLDELYRRFSPRLFGICLRYSKSRAEAEDLLHDGFIRILDHLKEFRNEGSFEGWLRRIMVTTAINHYRKHHGRIVSSEMVAWEEDRTASNDVLEQLAAKDIIALIEELPDGYRMVFNLYVIEGYKHREIAELLNITESTSKSQFMKARKVLIEKLSRLKIAVPE